MSCFGKGVEEEISVVFSGTKPKRELFIESENGKEIWGEGNISATECRSING
jgi:hypothetical protein